MNTEVKSIGSVEGRLVYPGDKLYIDIRGTCATEWGEPQVAHLGANDGQGPVIIFESGDYRMCDRLVWEPKPLPVVDPAEPVYHLPRYQNPDNYTREQLIDILTAFYDIAEGIEQHEYVDHTGDSCLASQENYGKARQLVSDMRWGRDILKPRG